MKSVTSFALLILVASMAFGGITSSAYAIDDPTILLNIATRAQEQFSNQISDDSSDKIKRLFVEGTQQVEFLEKSLQSDDTSAAKEHFLSAMKIFKEISRHLTSSSDVTSQDESSSASDAPKNPSNDLQRLQSYLKNLKNIAINHDALIDFSELDELVLQAKIQITNHQFVQALETIQEIKAMIVDVNKKLHETASKQELQRAKVYVQKYLEQLDRLIENAKNQGISDEIIEKLESSKENLSSIDDPRQIIEEIRKIMSLKDQFELTENYGLESRILQVEKTLSSLYQVDEIDGKDLINAEITLQSIKQNLYDGEFEIADEQLQELVKQLTEIKNSVQ